MNWFDKYMVPRSNAVRVAWLVIIAINLFASIFSFGDPLAIVNMIIVVVYSYGLFLSFKKRDVSLVCRLFGHDMDWVEDNRPHEYIPGSRRRLLRRAPMQCKRCGEMSS